jgi:uncharacterized protein
VGERPLRAYLDASTIIYCLESAAPLRQKVLERLSQVERIAGAVLLTSRLSRLECRVKPLREGNAPLLALYDEFSREARSV